MARQLAADTTELVELLRQPWDRLNAAWMELDGIIKGVPPLASLESDVHEVVTHFPRIAEALKSEMRAMPRGAARPGDGTIRHRAAPIHRTLTGRV